MRTYMYVYAFAYMMMQHNDINNVVVQHWVGGCAGAAVA